MRREPRVVPRPRRVVPRPRRVARAANSRPIPFPRWRRRAGAFDGIPRGDAVRRRRRGRERRDRPRRGSRVLGRFRGNASRGGGGGGGEGGDGRLRNVLLVHARPRWLTRRRARKRCTARWPRLAAGRARDDFASTRPRTSLRDDFASTRPRTSPLASSRCGGGRGRHRRAPSRVGRERSHRHPPRDHVPWKSLGSGRRASAAVGRLSDATDSSAEEVATEGAPTPRAEVTSLALDESAASEVATEGRPTPRASTAPRYSETFESEGAWGEDGFRPDAGPGPGLGSPRPPPAFPNLGPAEMDDEEAEISPSRRAFARYDAARAPPARRRGRFALYWPRPGGRRERGACGGAVGRGRRRKPRAVLDDDTRAVIVRAVARGFGGRRGRKPPGGGGGTAAMAPRTRGRRRAPPRRRRAARRVSPPRTRIGPRSSKDAARVPRARDRRTRTLGGVRGVGGGGSSGRRRRRRRLFCRRTRRRFRRTSSGRRRYSERRSTGRCARGSRRYARVCEPPFAGRRRRGSEYRRGASLNGGDETPETT